jgi:hypothetical protein
VEIKEGGPCSRHGRDVYKIMVGRAERRDNLEDLVLNGRIILDGF